MARFNDTNTDGFDAGTLEQMNQVYAWISDENPDHDYDEAHINEAICDAASSMEVGDTAGDLYEVVCDYLGFEAIGL